jgi:hypothetical protein
MSRIADGELEALDHLRRAAPEPSCKPEEDGEADVALAALDAPHVGSMQVGGLSERLLRETRLNTHLTHGVPQRRVFDGHLGHDREGRILQSIGLHTIGSVPRLLSVAGEAPARRVFR